MEPFDRYPGGGRQLLGPSRGTNARHEYGLKLQRVTGETTCAYCGVSLVDDFYRWLLLQVDHAVPVGQARRLGVPQMYYEDLVNLVLACAGCNGFNNRHTVVRQPQADWTLAEYLALRDDVFAKRRQRFAECRAREMAFFRGQPWRNVQ